MRIHVAIPLRWSDFDAYAHVNNAEMLRLLEEARIQAFWRPDSPQPGGRATAVLDARPGAPSITLIARQEVEYLAPIPYMRAPIDIELWIGRIGGASLEVCYELYSPEGVVPRMLYTRAATTLVLVTAATGRPERIPEALRHAWAPYVEEPVAFSKRG
ncbi:acyl-CoA thioesterase [Rathayibacter iranicus]|uniref:Acyl-CoA thioesterase n=2 Tax=Rathayibacter iranicus TaxID=59737 RepID=A0AAD1AET1_9MICO|nr:thioesterase family protein [Rathayibacter iranicus]AZZ55299.1 acyl-CoA thioesterase [Rathayibacter iranicus]MWV30977.1 acyl-CoA thioesterase [Rathayibacter iranicus NCPPB 2253 = VKM Ac-1602]PPI48088.1 4-hydroxybenzoyl-CoA thioesterase [Rathayibacter iranicus]PPI61304.1 4-hydroxybenzoyl-CoA thioesterase [Rathayibacter iranicus]PPI72751.1 4-hydroxybenzoyl-CoA thioesterase [Rathayibacter iranicus]